MSCQLIRVANFHEIEAVQRYLIPHLKQESSSEGELSTVVLEDQNVWKLEVQVEQESKTIKDGDLELFDLQSWDDSDWGWNDEEEEKAVENNKTNHNKSWLQECAFSISPTGDFLAIANEDRIVILQQKWDNLEKGEIQTKYKVIYQGSLQQDAGEEITSVLCLPLASQKRSTHGGPDWTCFIVGFNSGYVRMYTENGSLLLSQLLHLDPVVSLKCKTYGPPRYEGQAEQHEELTILYPKAIVTIDGFSLFQSLRACRNQVARAAASGSELMQPPPLAYKKWGIHDQDGIVDHVSCGVLTPNPFDEMQTVSMINGYNAQVKATPPASSLYVTTGSGPYVGFYYAIEGSAQPMLSDVAHAVASKLKSALFSQISSASSWLGLGSKQKSEDGKDKPKPKVEPATSLPLRFGLPDKRRVGDSIVLSPDNSLAATTDSFGRVMLLDLSRGIAVRMWKGYRDAQVGWIQVKEDTHQESKSKRSSRRALFLVIYAPRRGILEIWASQQGPRIAAFNVSKYCTLLCPGYGMLGLNNVTYQGVKATLHQCCLVDQDGGVMTIEAPFHLSLSDKNSLRARDIHLLKKLKIMLKETKEERVGLESDVCSLLLDMKIPSIRQQGLERVLGTKYLSATFLENVVKSVKEQLNSTQAEAMEVEGASEDAETPVRTDIECRILLQYCKAMEQLLQTYTAIEKFNTMDGLAEHTADLEKFLNTTLSLNETECQQLIAELGIYGDTLDCFGPRVQFSMDQGLTVADFLKCFDCHIQCLEKQASDGPHVKLQKSIPEDLMQKLAHFLYSSSINGQSSVDDLIIVLQYSSMPPDDLKELLLNFWLSEDQRSLSRARHLHTLLKAVTKMKDMNDLLLEASKLSPWWQSMREACSKSTVVGSALIWAITARSINSEIIAQHSKDKNDLSSSTNSSDLSDWESLSLDIEQWNVLIKQLEDVLSVQCLLKMKPTLERPLPSIAGDPIHISVTKVLDGGKGVIPEVVAKWMAKRGILPSMLGVHPEAASGEEDVSIDANKNENVAEEALSKIQRQLEAVQKRFPHSLESDILMANCCWEYMVQWNKDQEVVDHFQHALNYLTCIHNQLLQHGIAIMIWQTFLLKSFSGAALLMEKVGKAPKERLCRKDVGMTDGALTKFIGLVVEFQDALMQANCGLEGGLSFHVEDLWQNLKGPTSLAELATDQREANYGLIRHHYHLAIVMHATLVFTMKSVKPLSLFDTKGRNAFFKELRSHPLLPNKNIDMSITNSRKQFLTRVITHAVMTLGERPQSPEASTASSILSPTTQKHLPAIHWPALCLQLGEEFGIDEDYLRRNHACELYSSGLDKLAEEVVLAVNDHAVMGSQLILLAGQRLAYFIVKGDPATSLEKLSKLPPTLSTWIKSLDSSQLRCPNPPLCDTAALIGQVINQLPEGHTEYNMAISLVEVVQSFL